MKPVNLDQLAKELTAAGIKFRGLTSTDMTTDTVFTFDDGDPIANIIPLPPEAQQILDLHVPPDPPAYADFGTDEPEPDFHRQAPQVVQNLREYLALGTNGKPAPTPAQTVAVIKIIIRVVLALIRYVLAPPPPQPVPKPTPLPGFIWTQEPEQEVEPHD